MLSVRRSIHVFLAFGSLLATSCRDTTDAGRLHRARQLWQSNHVSAYRYTVATSCFCLALGPIEAEVRNGVVVSWRRTDGGEIPSNMTFTLTVDSLFANIQRAMNRSESSVTAEYNPALGYPTHANIDWIKNAVDDEIAYEVLSLTVLQTAQ
jgi:Family of unknown function (DUF6174)